MKNLRTFILVCLLAFMFFPATAQMEFTVDGFDYAITSTTDLTVEVVNGPDIAVVTVPSTVVPSSGLFSKRTFRVTSICSGAFSWHGNLESVDMPYITDIDDGIFTHCRNLRQVNMPAATSIGNWAFSDCDALTSVSMPAATSIDREAFYGCNALTSVSMPAATSIDGSAFSDCKSLSDIFVGEQPAHICSKQFDDDTYATVTLHVPSGCASKYRAADGWRWFDFISEDYDPTGIKNTNAENVKVSCENGCVKITGLKNGEKIVFYSVDGRTLATEIAYNGNVSFSAHPGKVVIVKYRNKCAKIAL